MSTTRITVASLAAAIEADRARTAQQFADVVGVLGKIVERLDGQHNTPAPVVEITTAKGKRAKKAAKTVQPQVSTTAPAKREMPAEVREGFAMVKATKDAISPLNKALAQVRKGQPWVKVTECSTEEVTAALAMVEALHGRKVAKAALAAYETRKAAAAARK